MAELAQEDGAQCAAMTKEQRGTIFKLLPRSPSSKLPYLFLFSASMDGSVQRIR